MVARKHGGLGKGLGALIPDKIEETKESVNTIDINLIKANEEQPRKYFDNEKIANLAQSIKEHGIIQPIVLMKNGDFYTIVAGERRWRAAKSIGMREMYHSNGTFQQAIIRSIFNREYTKGRFEPN